MRRLSMLALFAIGSACGGVDAADAPGIAETSDEAAATGTDAALLSASARVWRTSTTLAACGSRAVSEDFSSGRYNAHRWSVTVPPGELEIALVRSAGRWQPALVLADGEGDFITDGEAVAGSGAVSVSSGRTGDTARVRITLARSTAIQVFTTAWGAVDSDYSAGVTTSAEYALRLVHTCPSTGGTSGGTGGTTGGGTTGGGTPASGWAAVHAGIDRAGSHIPRAGLANSTLRASLGVSVEPYGTTTTRDGLAFVRGRVSSFGGPNDTGVSSTETGAITGERLRSLNSPLNPSASTLSARPEAYYYAAMRFDYAPNGRTFWRDARLLVVNPSNGRAIVVRPVDWGPNTSTRRLVDLSPQALRDLALPTDGEAFVAFAAPGTALGVVR